MVILIFFIKSLTPPDCEVRWCFLFFRITLLNRILRSIVLYVDSYRSSLLSSLRTHLLRS